MTIAERIGLSKPVNKPGIEGTRIKAPRLPGPKNRVAYDVILLSILLLSCSASFGLGMLAGRETGAGKSEDQLWIEKLGLAAEQPAAVEEGRGTSETPKGTTKSPPATVPVSGGEVVASKTGTKYYLPWCGTVARIKEENKVWFATREAAEAAGYEPAKNCKGL